MMALPLISALGALASSSVGVAPIASDDPQAAIQIEEMLLDAARSLDGRALVSRVKMQQHISDAAKLGVSCQPGQAECFARVGALSGVDLVVVAEYSADVSTLRCRAARADGRVLNDISARLSASPADRKLGVLAAVRASVTGADLRGALDVVTTVDGARVTLDGDTLDLSALAPGVRLLRVAADGFIPHDQEVEIFAGVKTRVVVKLNPIGTQAPPPEDGASGLFISGAVATGVGLVAAAGLGISAGVVYAPESERPNMTAAEWNLRSKVLAPILGWSAVGSGAVGVLGLGLMGLSSLE